MGRKLERNYALPNISLQIWRREAGRRIPLEKSESEIGEEIENILTYIETSSGKATGEWRSFLEKALRYYDALFDWQNVFYFGSEEWEKWLLQVRSVYQGQFAIHVGNSNVLRVFDLITIALYIPTS